MKSYSTSTVGVAPYTQDIPAALEIRASRTAKSAKTQRPRGLPSTTVPRKGGHAEEASGA